MGRPRTITKSFFSVPKISGTIAKRSLVKRVIQDIPMQREEPKKIVNPSVIPDIEMGPKRAGLLKRLVERGKIKQSSLTFGELQLKASVPDLEHTEVNCMDEAELRSRFPKQGVNHKFFSTGVFKFEFLLPSNSDKVVVAQVLRNGKVRMPQDL